METHVDKLKKYIKDNGIRRMNITTAYSMGVGKKPTKEQLAKEALEFLKASERSTPLSHAIL